MKKIIFPIITVLLILAAVAVIAEIGFRIKDYFTKDRGLRNAMGDIDRNYCNVFKQNSRYRLRASRNNEFDVGIRINNCGFRGKNITKEKTPGTARIMVIGDSFTFGVGAEEDETIPFLIEKCLLDQGRKAEVINAGFGSYSTVLHYLRLKNEYLELKPDLVLYLFGFSDLADDWRYEKNLVYDKSGNILRCDPTFIDGKRDWWKTARVYSKLCVYIHNKVVRLIGKIRTLGLKNYIKAKMEGKRAKAVIIEKMAKEKKSGAAEMEYDAYLMMRGRHKLPEVKEHLKRTEKYLKLIKGILDKEGIPMVMVIYPCGIHVGPDQWGSGRVYWGFEKGRIYDDYYAFELMEDCAGRNDLPYINLLPAFLKNSKKELFFDFDGHFTPEANRVAAETIARDKTFLRELNNL